MPKAKQENALSFKISSSMIARIKEECDIESRSQSDMAKLLLAEALMSREGKRNIAKIL